MTPTTVLLNYPASMQPAPRAKPVDSWLPSHLVDGGDPENWTPLHQPKGPSGTGTESLQSASNSGAAKTGKPGQGAESPRAGTSKPKPAAKPSNLSDAKPKNKPAAGASGGSAPLPATFFPARYLNTENPELCLFFNVLRDPLCTHLYLLIEGHSDFKTGEILTTYARLMELCTPPQPERGRRRPGPTMAVIRRAVDDLVRFGAMRRGTKNEEQGQLRLWITKLQPKNLGMPTE